MSSRKRDSIYFVSRKGTPMKKIKEVSCIAGVTKRTLQYYDDENLLCAKRSQTNDRLYDEEQLRRLWQILVYKDLGLRLSQIKEIFRKENEKEILGVHLMQLDEERSEIERKMKMTEDVLKYGIPPVDFEERRNKFAK